VFQTLIVAASSVVEKSVFNQFDLYNNIQTVLKVSIGWAFYACSSYHCEATLDLGPGIVEPFYCLVIQNCQSSMGRLMNWTVRTKWSMVFSSAPHSQATEGAILHLHNQDQKRPKLVRRRLSQTHTVLGRAVPGGWVPVLGMKARSLIRLSNHSALHQWPTQPHIDLSVLPPSPRWTHSAQVAVVALILTSSVSN